MARRRPGEPDEPRPEPQPAEPEDEPEDEERSSILPAWLIDLNKTVRL